MIWVYINCDLCKTDIVHGAKTMDGAEFIAREKPNVIVEGEKHFCNEACRDQYRKEAA